MRGPPRLKVYRAISHQTLADSRADAYGLEKLYAEEICKHYGNDFGFEARIARFHNIYGPQGTWRGGREKAPGAATFSTKVCSHWCGVSQLRSVGRSAPTQPSLRCGEMGCRRARSHTLTTALRVFCVFSTQSALRYREPGCCCLRSHDAVSHTAG